MRITRLPCSPDQPIAPRPEQPPGVLRITTDATFLPPMIANRRLVWHPEGMTVALEKELETFRRELSALLADPANRGQFALVHGDVIAGIYPSFDAALSAGYERFG